MSQPENNQVGTRVQANGNFCWQHNEMYDLFQKAVGSTAVAVYANLTRRAYGAKTFGISLRELGTAMGQSRATVSRELKILASLGVIRIRTIGGNRPDEYELTDLRELARRWGARYSGAKRAFELPQGSTERLRAEVERLRRELQGKAVETPSTTQKGSAQPPDSQRDASVPLEKRQRPAKETKMGSHPLTKNKRQEDSLSPTPFQIEGLWKSKDVSEQRHECEMSLKDARDLFCGVVNGVKGHLVNPNRPELSHLNDGYDDWLRFGFEGMKVVGVSESGGAIRLVLSAFDQSAARQGLSKYHRTWSSSFQSWFGREVHVEWQAGPLKGWEGGGGSKSPQLLQP